MARARSTFSLRAKSGRPSSANALRSRKVTARPRPKIVQHQEIAFLDDVGAEADDADIPLASPSERCEAKSLPALIVYDLDDTVWFPELYMLRGGAPFKKLTKAHCEDGSGDVIGTYASARGSMAMTLTHKKFIERGCRIAIASRTHRGKWARDLMDKFEINGAPMSRCCVFVEIASGTKANHFKRIRELSGVRFEDMLFFDNERNNCVDVAALGVKSVHCPSGMTADAWRLGLQLFVPSDCLDVPPSKGLSLE